MWIVGYFVFILCIKHSYAILIMQWVKQWWKSEFDLKCSKQCKAIVEKCHNVEAHSNVEPIKAKEATKRMLCVKVCEVDQTSHRPWLWRRVAIIEFPSISEILLSFSNDDRAEKSRVPMMIKQMKTNSMEVSKTSKHGCYRVSRIRANFIHSRL